MPGILPPPPSSGEGGCEEGLRGRGSDLGVKCEGVCHGPGGRAVSRGRCGVCKDTFRGHRCSQFFPRGGVIVGEGRGYWLGSPTACELGDLG